MTEKIESENPKEEEPKQAAKPLLFGAYSPVVVHDKRTNGYRGGNGDSKLRGAK